MKKMTLNEFINDPETHVYASWVLNMMNMPAPLLIKFMDITSNYNLYCFYNSFKYRVTGVSSHGSIWLSEDLSSGNNCDALVNVGECTGWTNKA